MELEMKYSIPSKETADEIWEKECRVLEEETARPEVLVMKAVYFDTEDRVLAKNNVTVRVRAEGEGAFATLKWGGSSSNGFHQRQEINIPVFGETCFIQPPTDLFAESEDGQKLMKLIGKKPLTNLLETRFLRKRCRISEAGCLAELSIDMGSIITDRGETPIHELEIELFAGQPAGIEEIGKRLAEKYGLTPENRSKFARGLELLNG